MQISPIPYGKQDITDKDIEAVVNVLKSDFLTQGPSVVEFEKKFAEYIGVKYAVAVSNGTAALHLSALALDVKQGDNVITTPITFVASANCIKYCDGNVSFTDIDAKTYLLDIDKLHSVLKSFPKGTFKGVIPVDFAGYPVDLEKLREIADEFGLWILEDACHAPGGYFIDSKGVKHNCGNCDYADVAIFSFHPVKHIATGEGGMITTNNEDIYNKLLLLRTHGITKSPELLTENHGGWYYEMQELGFNYRLTDIQAALGISQLDRAKDGIERRRVIASKYNLAFTNTKLKIPFTANDNYTHAYHLFIIQYEDRLGLYNYLKSNNIFTQVHYIPVHLQPYYKAQGNNKGDFPIAENYYEHCLSLPMYPSLTDNQQDYVINTILEYINK
ncbi:MAG: UDP-4-amino-4,6-dideoxy-N-acetyl-beta-L-altrosamine transaminase [Bacteroidetes bacterium GWE2_29_8]|nr:MAG: UDP-4-amino-4,6-dideoxy-N-acetyl-beta-L-altrosamine transaminase [Bacteroidetes bacterium GWE2_29_8]OFY18273.1 MAG: UDP-4-amino-4,6-dideoxy-N-acetyl-beta-L-altrosamine transaminase [Bacteroidetes bacterium GWF2_29_10]